MIILWRSALRIMEDSVRSALSSTQDSRRTQKEMTLDACKNLNRISNFLMTVMADTEPSALSFDDMVNDVASFYTTVSSEKDLVYLQAEMECSTKRALLRLSALREIALLLSNIQDSEDTVAPECITCMLPRLMGRSWAKLGQSRQDQSVAHAHDLGGYYLAQLYLVQQDCLRRNYMPPSPPFIVHLVASPSIK